MRGDATSDNGRSGQEWRGSARYLLATFAASLVLFMLMVVVIDPYDSGRFPTFMPSGSADERAPTIDISRGRNPSFNAVLLGSSRAVMVDPRRLSETTGYRFVELAAEGATVREQTAILRWFAFNRPRTDPRVEVIVVATDQPWCDRDPALIGERDFPYGLYDPNVFVYLKTALSLSTFRFAFERVKYALGIIPGIDPQGYFDTGATHDWRWVPELPQWNKAANDRVAAVVALPSLVRLDAYLKDVAGEPHIVFWMPPIFHDHFPPPGTVEAVQLEECKMALRRWVAARGHAAFVDFALDTSEAADRGNFLDWSHASKRFLRELEPRIADAINQVK